MLNYPDGSIALRHELFFARGKVRSLEPREPAEVCKGSGTDNEGLIIGARPLANLSDSSQTFRLVGKRVLLHL